VNIRPLHDRVLLKRLEESEDRIGSIVIPDTAKEKPQRAEVISVGDGVVLESGERVPLEVKPGDTVLLGKYSGAEAKVEGQEYVIVREDEILGVLTD
jgi:chaperonin GroES